MLKSIRKEENVCVFLSRGIYIACVESLCGHIDYLFYKMSPRCRKPRNCIYIFPKKQAHTWALSGNISLRLVLLQRQRKVVVEHSNRCMQVANPLKYLGPT